MERAKRNVNEEVLTSPAPKDGGVIFNTKKPVEDDSVKNVIRSFDKKGEIQLSDKYKKQLMSKAKDNPEAVMVKTPQGWMTVAEAMRKGFNPETDKFDNESVEARIDRIIKEENLSPEEAEQVKALLMKRGQEEPQRGELEQVPGQKVPGPVPTPVPEGQVKEEGKPAPDPGILAALGGQ